MKLKTYMDNNENLPDFIKDFHDQKDLFKAIYEQYGKGNNQQILKDINWVNAHVYTIDVFLWWMGMHGYKLQKIRKKDIKFHCPLETIKYHNDLRRDRF